MHIVRSFVMDQQQIEHFQANGYVNVSGLFSDAETQRYIDHYMEMRERKNREEALDQELAGNSIHDPNDPLRQFARLMHPHRHDQLSLDWMLDPRLRDALTALCGKTPYAVQTMVYF